MSNFNPNIKFTKKTVPDVKELFKNIVAGDRFSLSKAITLVESEKDEHKKIAKELINICLSKPQNSLRIGITGSPGVGKSTLLESLGLHIIGHNKKPAILAVDPSSNKTKGSILGDKTRMNSLSISEEAFIRPSPSGSTLGGVAQKTRESIILSETAGFNPVFIETVGVGQSEIAVHSMTDLFILLIQPGSGDEIQGIKRGIMEMADIIVINKADKDNIIKAKTSYNHYANAMRLFGQKENGWTTEIMMTSAIENTGVNKLWEIIKKYEKHVKSTGFFEEKRRKQNINWFHDYLFKRILDIYKSDDKLSKEFDLNEGKVAKGILSPYQAGDILFNLLVKKEK